MAAEIDISTAKDQLKRIDELLNGEHLLIGGLAVQQYHKPRNTKDIDLVCDRETARHLVEELYPTKDYNIEEINDDEFRPSYEITHKVNKNRIVFFGPKILERPSYNSIDWEKLRVDAIPFSYKREQLSNVRVPRMEALAFMKLLAFADRAKSSPDKGRKDLVDFVNLTNHDDFRFNQFINLIRESRTERYLAEQISELDSFERPAWRNSLFMDFASILHPFIDPAGTAGLFDDNVDRIFTVDHSVEFFDLIAPYYDERNTKFVLDTHRAINRSINSRLNKKSVTKVIDIGGGTGRLVATQYAEDERIEWHCVEPSSGMRKQFEQNFRTASLKPFIHPDSVFGLSDPVLKNSYDVAILSLVLSTLPRDPDFSEIAGTLTPGGSLIIADFLDTGLIYDVNTNEEKFELHTRLVPVVEVMKSCLDAGLKLETIDKVDNPKNRGLTYILEFIRPED